MFAGLARLLVFSGKASDPDAVENCACSVFFRDRLGAHY